MRVLGIDPGSNCTGIGIVEEKNGGLSAVHWSSIRSKPKQNFPARLKMISTVGRPYASFVKNTVGPAARSGTE